MLQTIPVRDQIAGFLAEKRIAIVGVSRTPNDFTRMMMQEFVKRGYDVVPVNPAVQELDGRRCYARVQEIQPPVKAALIMTKPGVTEQIVHDCAQAGIRQVWLHKGVGPGAASDTAIRYCQEHEIRVIPGFCPFMFFEQTQFFHRAHVFMLRLGGNFPTKAH